MSGVMVNFNATAEQSTRDLMVYAKMMCMELKHEEINEAFMVNQPKPDKAELFIFFQKIGLVNPDGTFNDCACSSIINFDRNKIN